MIIISDLYKIITINLFIDLLPYENFQLFCCNANNFILISNQVIRFIPGLLSITINILQDDKNWNFFSINIGFNTILFLICMIIILKSSKLKSNSLTRILYLSSSTI